MSVKEVTVIIRYEGESKPHKMMAKHIKGLHWKLEVPRRDTTYEASDVDVAKAASVFVQNHLGVRI